MVGQQVLPLSPVVERLPRRPEIAASGMELPPPATIPRKTSVSGTEGATPALPLPYSRYSTTNTSDNTPARTIVREGFLS